MAQMALDTCGLLWLATDSGLRTAERRGDHGQHRQRASAGGVDTPPELRAGILSPADVALACEARLCPTPKPSAAILPP